MKHQLAVPGISIPTNAGWEVPAQTDDNNPWRTGRCWLYCRRLKARVVWIGPAEKPGVELPMYACAQCLEILDEIVREETTLKDTGSRTPPQPDLDDHGRHRAPPVSRWWRTTTPRLH